MSGGTVFFTYGCLPSPSWWNMPPIAKNSCWPPLFASARLTWSIRMPSRCAMMLRCLRHSRHAPSAPTAITRPHPVQVPAGFRSRHALHPGHSQP
jgi:hypothetical protein